ncbi:MAG: hypothetical protein Q8S73_27720 [Deltaproteobacteria bacterium]|nr:hypothetical protein [Myxococcales bacterium]MDP3217925.1 hypothetical protein [Deltaproteobacteria bacterium]
MNTPDYSSNGHHASSDALHHPIEAIKALMPPETVRVVQQLPEQLRTELRERPYRTLAVAMAVGVGIGALASSRITRFLVKNLGSFALAELARRGAAQYLTRALSAH